MGWDTSNDENGPRPASSAWATSHPGALGKHPGLGDVVGGLKLVSRLGAGGMATVYRAEGSQYSEAIALKILDPGRVLEEDVKRFAREFKVQSRMDHPNVVQVYDSGVHEGYPWLAMELVEGTDLETLIEQWKVKPEPDRFERVERIVRGLCMGLQFVHDQGMIHRDLKPSNVLIGTDGEPKLSDFGVVKGGNNTANTQLTMAGRLVGTVAFMAPELIVAEGIDRRADLYALGAVLYVMLTFRRPIEAESVAGYLARHLTEVPRAPHEIEPAAPATMERICLRLLQKDPSWRYPTAQAVLQALERGELRDTPPVRGRDDQIGAFGRRLVELQRGAGAVVALLGDPGSGKTHLMQSLVDQARANGVQVAAATADGSGTLARLLEAAGGEADGSVNDLKRLARVLRNEAWVLAIDDLDRASPGAIAAIARLMRQRVGLEGEPVLLLFSATDPEGPLATLISGESTGLPCAQQGLGPLDAKSVTAMLRDRRLKGPSASALGRRLHEAYGGRPGPIVEQFETMCDDGWFDDDGEHLRGTRSIDEIRRCELPVPASIVAELTRRLEGLRDDELELLRLLALLDRPASESLLSRTADGGRGSDVPARVEALIGRGLLVRVAPESPGDPEPISFAVPGSSQVLREPLDPHTKQLLHGRIARALRARRRRANALEIATHRRLSGDLEGAYPLYIQAARRAARDGRQGDVLGILADARKLEPHAARSLDKEERARLARWTHQLEGEAHLARRRWADAVGPLTKAIELARADDDDQALARCLSGLGRAYYRQGAFADAEPLLREAVNHTPESTPERAGAVRALADVELRHGRVGPAEELLTRALDTAVDHTWREAEARARRGLAHVRTVQGRYGDAIQLLMEADDQLAQDGDPFVRAGVMSMLGELEAASGRLGSALWRSEALVDHARRHGMSDRLPEAYALLADILSFVADPEARDAARQALVFADASGASCWAARLQAARVLHRMGDDDAEAQLPSLESVPDDPIRDPAAQLAALRARIRAASDPKGARDLAVWALGRPAPVVRWFGARVALDASVALRTLGHDDAARDAAKRGLALVKGTGADALRVELMIALFQAREDTRVIDALGKLLPRVVRGLPPNALDTFRDRAVIRDVIG